MNYNTQIIFNFYLHNNMINYSLYYFNSINHIDRFIDMKDIYSN